MKKRLLYLLLITVSLSASAKTLDDVMAEFSKAPHAEKVNLGKFACSILKISIGSNKDADILKKINSLYVLDLENCSAETKLEFAKQIDNLGMNGYELLMKVKDDQDHVLIMSKSKKDTITEFIIISINDPAIIRLKGNFNPSDLADINKKYGSKKKS